MGLNDETTDMPAHAGQLIRQVRIDLRFLMRAIEALDDKVSTAKTAQLKQAVANWLDTFFVEEPKGQMRLIPEEVEDMHFDPRAILELAGTAMGGEDEG